MKKGKNKTGPHDVAGRAVADQDVKPVLIAYHVRDDGDSTCWDRIGVAFAHKDSQGIDVVLDTIPLSGRVVLRAPSDGGAPGSGKRGAAKA